MSAIVNNGGDTGASRHAPRWRRLGGTAAAAAATDAEDDGAAATHTLTDGRQWHTRTCVDCTGVIKRRIIKRIMIQSGRRFYRSH
jgi:hypothetical protein